MRTSVINLAIALLNSSKTMDKLDEDNYKTSEGQVFTEEYDHCVALIKDNLTHEEFAYCIKEVS